ncbi:MAG: hypothetical protein CO162_00645 [bacterium (Candidatus Ratteibacteria) CG_4_9_14_3_um_filter_41_21]|uniref:Uncharacterized protein n=2 Tax=Candidatus Ratteibacteria TaxID=2979319 RepID=A0A2M7EA45_9BACT|nr:hypothetical protein [Nitrospirota bacterium]PIV64561.1 MAG: hypothetical protein COS11_01555 [bacterium (Candidatus Ratteibacteria) CG01_land_8_20_14_3_00_40_19]PJA62524.1 MAG: hypothetical protein CO162_00645 [bacterium (Candidatus Ratteibacteria) CG_4_9_14_3_um_filter_41_21]
MKKGVIDSLSPDEAKRILNILVERDKSLRKEAEKLANDILKEVDMEGIAEDVLFELNNLDVHEVWDNSGGRSDGSYVEPGECAIGMVEEVIEPYVEEMKRYSKLGFHKQAFAICCGVILGLYKFEYKSTTEFKDWAVDAPGEIAGYILDEAVKLKIIKRDNFKKFTEEFIPNWKDDLARN